MTSPSLARVLSAVLLFACGGGCGGDDDGGGGGSDGGSGGGDGGSDLPSCPDVAGEPVAVDLPFVSDGEYFYKASGGQILRTPVDGGASQTLADSPAVIGLMQLADERLYFVAEDAGAYSLWQMSAGGGTPSLVMPIEDPQVVRYAVDGELVYVFDVDGTEWVLRSVPRTGGDPVELARGPGDLAGAPQVPAALAGQGGRLYWVTRGGFVRSIDAAGGAITDLADSAIDIQANKDLPDIALSDTHVAWSIIQQAQTSFPIFRVPLDGGERETLLDDEVQALRLVHWDGSLYFVDVADPSDHHLGRVPAAGGPWEVVACYEPASSIGGVVVDQTGIYARTPDGTVRFAH
ncbi:MAG TPA: hypothetical protein VKZ63_00365 [Kofleriaceae bacterium]|nr:hypothetical protein [Kofleriaceae bacterium]